MRASHRVAAVALAITLAAGLSACGDDDDDAAAERSTTTTTEEAPTLEVTAVDYAFQGLPETIGSGTRIALENESTAELHEIVLFRLPEGEDRSVEELMALPEEEQGAVFRGEPAAVLLAPPGGGEQIEAVGDGTVTGPGRYVAICSIPQGADPEAYLNAPPSDGPPQVEGGPPHFVLGMHAEFEVT